MAPFAALRVTLVLATILTLSELWCTLHASPSLFNCCFADELSEARIVVQR
jgi:hypothetical protein